MSPSRLTPQESAQIVSAKVFELWGDSPIFPGPAWRLSWPLSGPEQRRLNKVLVSGSLWRALQANFPDLAALTDPWQPRERLGEQLESLAPRAIAVLADAFMQPISLEICDPFVPVKLEPACLVLRCDQHELAGRALAIAATLIQMAQLAGNGVRSELSSLRHTLADLMLKLRLCCDHSLTTAQLAEARRRGIPAFLLDPGQRLYQLGSGIHSRWISSTSNDRDSAFGVVIARDKSKTHNLLRQLGLPVPAEIVLPSRVSDKQLTAAAERLGYPCVLKPNDGEQGHGVTTNITNEEELLEALGMVRGSIKGKLLLQKHVDGEDYRLNVINDKVAFAVRRRPPVITGNGSNSVLELIMEQNIIRRKLRQQGAIAAEINPDDPEVLGYIAKIGLQTSSVPDAGHQIQLRGNANVSTGGMREELDLQVIHPAIQEQCVAIARTLRLESCGIDYISSDISLAPSHSLGAFIEVNSMPQNATSRANLLIENLFPDSQPHSIPATIVIGDWSQASIADIMEIMPGILRLQPEATIGVPLELRHQIWPLLPGSLQRRAHVYSHPRELLLNHATIHAIYLTNSELVLHRGLPAAFGAAIICITPPSSLKPVNAWQRLIGHYNWYPA